MTDQAVITDIDSRGVATVTLNRGEKHNAFDDAMIAALRQTFDEIACNDSLKVVVLASTGRNFSAGADLGWMQRMAEYDYEHNMAVANERASFCLSEVKIGLIPATISPFVVRAMGERACRRYFTTAERFDAQRALQLGLVSEVVCEEELDHAVDTLVDAVLGNGPVAVRAAKQLVEDISGSEISAQLVEETCQRIATIRVSTEGQEGLAAFLNKRAPAWSNSN